MRRRNRRFDVDRGLILNNPSAWVSPGHKQRADHRNGAVDSTSSGDVERRDCPNSAAASATTRHAPGTVRVHACPQQRPRQGAGSHTRPLFGLT